MKRMIAESKLRQDGNWYRSGQEFECNDQDAEDLRAMKLARYVASDMQADKPKRRYLRRDMTAQ